MDFHCMKRKELQALCKKHKILANLSNQEMASKLTEIFKEKENPLIKRPIKEQDENLTETESADADVNREVKKVRFSPDHELIEFTRSPKMKRRSSKNSGLSRDSSLSVVNIESSEMKKENLGGIDRVTRSRELKSMEVKVNLKKRRRIAVKREKTPNASAIEIFDKGKLKEGDVDSSGRVMLLRGEMLELGEKNAKKREKIGAKDDYKRVEKALDDEANEKPTHEIVDNPGRVTRFRVQKLTEVHPKVEKRRKKAATIVGNVALIGAATAENSGDVGDGQVTKDSSGSVISTGKGDVLENKKISEECHATEPQILRRSRRNANMVAGSEILNVDTKKRVNGESMGLRKTSKLLALNENGESGNEVNLGRRAVPNTEEPIKAEPRRSNRRKNVVESDELKVELENRHTLRSSVPQLGIVGGEVSKDKKNVVQPVVAMRRSSCKTLSLKLVSADEEIDSGLAVENPEAETNHRHLLSSVPQLDFVIGASKEEKKVLQPCGMMRRSRRKTLNLTASANEKSETDAAVENLESEKNRNEPCKVEKECSAVQKNTRRSRRISSKCKSRGLPDEIGRDSVIRQKNKAMKRRRGAISGRDVKKSETDLSSVAETMKESNSKKAVAAAAISEVADTKMRSRLNDFKLFDVSSHNGLEREEPILTSSKLSASEGLGSTSNLGISIDPSPQNVISNVGLTSSRNTHRKKPNISIADSAGSSEMKLINGDLSNSDKKAASKTRELKTDITDSECQSSANISGVNNANSPLEIDAQELIEQDIKVIDKNENEPDAHVLSQTENLGCNNNIVNQVLPEDLNESFDEKGTSTDSLSIGDQTDNNDYFADDVEVAEAEAEVDKCFQPSPCVVGHAGEVKGICAQQNLDSDGTRKDCHVPPEDSKISENEGFAETAASFDNLLLDDQTDIKTDVEVAEIEADKGLQLNPSVADHVGEAKGISAQENLDSDETRQDYQVLPEGANVSGKEVLAETGSSVSSPLLGDQTDIKTAVEVAEIEADKCLQPNPCVVDHVGEANRISAQENLDSDETGQAYQVLPEGSNISGKEVLAETGSSASSPLLGNQTDIKTDVEVAEIEADKGLLPNPSVVDHVGEANGISAQENLDSDETRQDYQVLPEGSTVSGKEVLAETGSSASIPLLGDQTDIKTDVEVAEIEADKGLQPNPSVVDHVGEANGISAQENLDSDETRKDYQVLPEGSTVSRKEVLAETGSSASSPLLGDQTDIKTDVEVAEIEADKGLQPNPSVVDHVVKANGLSAQENLDSDETRPAYQVLPEGSNVSGKEVLAEIGSSATSSPLLGDQIDIMYDLEAAEAEIDKCLETSPIVIEHVGEVKGTSIQKNLEESDGTRQDNQVLPDGSNASGKEGLVESGLFNSLLLGDQMEIKADLEVAEPEASICLQSNPSVVDYADEVQGVSVQENLDYNERKQDNHVLPEGSNVSGTEGAEGDKCLQTSPSVVDHVSEAEPISVQENLESGETNQANDITSPLSCHCIEGGHLEASSNILDNFNKYTSPKSGVVGTFDSCERHIDYSRSKCTLELEAPSSGMLRRIEGINLAEDNKIVHNDIASDLAETNEDACLNVHKSASYKDSEPSVPDLSDGEGSAKIALDRVVFSGEYLVMNSDEQGKYKDSLAVGHITNSTEINVVSGHETDHTPRREETYLDQNLNLKDGKSVEGGPSKGHKSKCDEDGVFSVSNLFDTEERPVIMTQYKEIISGDHSIMDFDEQGMHHGSPSSAPTTMCLFTRDLEADLIAEGIEAYICNDKQTELSHATGSGCFKSHKRSKDEDWEFNISQLFDGEKSARITQQYREMVSPGYSIKGFNEQVTFLDFASVSTLSANYNEVKFSAECSNLQETSSSKLISVSAEQPKEPLAERTAVANTAETQEAWSNASETVGHGMSLLEANAEGNTSLVVEGSRTDEDANDARCGKDKEDFGGDCITDIKITTECTIGEIEVESLTDMKSQGKEETGQQHSKNLLARQTKAGIGENPTDVDSIQSWTGTELQNLFATTFDNGTPGLNDTSSNRGSFTKKKEIEMEEERRSECGKTTYENVVLAENQLATPIKIVPPCKIDEVSSHGTEPDRTVMSVMECLDKMKENELTENKSDEKGQDAGYELERSFCVGDPSDNGEDVICKGLNKVDSVDGCEYFEEQLTENTGECVKETNLVTEADKEEDIIPLGESCLFDEASDNDIGSTEKIRISSLGSPRNIDKLQGYQDMLIDTDLPESLCCKSRVDYKSEGQISHSGETEIELSDSDLQKSNVPQKSHHLTICSEDVSILGESSIETCRSPVDAEVATIGFFDGQKDLIDKGAPPFHCSKEFPSYEVTERGDSIREDADPYGTKIQDETDGNPRSSQGDNDKSLTETPVFTFEGDHGTSGKEVEKSSTEFSASQLHFEEKVEDFSNHVHTISDVPSSGCTEILKESDVDDTIKEYIDSESSLPMIFENSGASLPIDVTAFCEYEEDVANSEGEVDKPLVDSLEAESKESEEATLVIETGPGSEKAVKSPACVDSLAEGSADINPLVEMKGIGDSRKQIESKDRDRSHSKQPCSTVKKNARTIMIHGTPGKLLSMADMKENAPTRKSSNAGDLTAVRPAKRRVLQDVRWK